MNHLFHFRSRAQTTTMADHDDDAGSAGEERPRISPELTREIVLSSLAAAGVSSSEKPAGNNKPLKMTNEAVLATAELLRLFVVEARGRAAVEAECEAEGAGTAAFARRKSDASDDDDDDDAKDAGSRVLIGAHHITKLAAELLLEFS
jgi:CENP-S associating Centromere protein X